ncbi:MAG TPA: dTDP-4-dehydrorhamnose 3,5-epimerase family protein [Terriglobia bacterium]|nr:dTDP-4-dehydrorhamnose 3,5-epimerase family protein [Terriglobia bacterium]
MTMQSTRLVAERAGTRLIIASRTQLGCGDVIASPQAPPLIHGVEVEVIAQFPDDRGCFAELFRFGEPGLARDFGPANGNRIQVSYTISYPGVIKALHYHFEQTDLWAPICGMLQVILYDLRESSPTCGRLNTMFVGASRPWKLRIPPGIAHGYKVLGTESSILVYAMDRLYNPQDEGRIPYDDPGINYDWVTRPR